MATSFKISLAGTDDIRKVSIESVSLLELRSVIEHLFGLASAFSIKYLDSDNDLISVLSNDDLNEAKRSGGVIRLTVFVKKEVPVASAPLAGDAPFPVPPASPAPSSSSSSSSSGFPSGSGDAHKAYVAHMIEAFPQLQEVLAGLGVDPNVLSANPSDPRSIGVILDAISNLGLDDRRGRCGKRCSSNESGRTCSPLSGEDPAGSQHNRSPTQHHATCDKCNKVIDGVRFKCGNCVDFDLCEPCEVDGPLFHDPSHVFLKIRKPFSHSTRLHPYAFLPNFYVPQHHAWPQEAFGHGGPFRGRGHPHRF